MVLIGVEVEAHTTGEAVSERFLFVVEELFFLIGDQFKLDDLLSLKLVLHEVPVGHATVRGDRVEVQILAGLFGLPSDLPHGVGVLGGPDGRLIDGLVILVADIEDHYGTVVATSSDKCGLIGVEVDAHDTALGGELVLGPGKVLDGVAADETCLRGQEVVATV